MNNSRQNTRLRWRDAKTLEKFANGIDDNSNITFPGNIIVNSADNIVDKDGNPIAGGGEKEIIELKNEKAAFLSQADYNKVVANPQKYIGRFKKDQYDYDTWVNFSIQTRSTSSSLIGYAIGYQNGVSGIGFCVITIIFYYSYSTTNLYSLYAPDSIYDYRMCRCTVNSVSDTNGNSYTLTIFVNGKVGYGATVSSIKSELIVSASIYDKVNKITYHYSQLDQKNNIIYFNKLSDNSQIQISATNTITFDTINVIHGVA